MVREEAFLRIDRDHCLIRSITEHLPSGRQSLASESRNYIAFAYPHTIVFSLTPIPAEVTSLDAVGEYYDRLEKNDNLGKDRKELHIEEIVLLTEALLRFTNSIAWRPIIVLDSRFVRVLDEGIVTMLIEHSTGRDMRLFILACDDVRESMLCKSSSSDKEPVCVSFDEFKSEYARYVNASSVVLKLENPATLATLESTLRQFLTGYRGEQVHKVRVDLTGINKISTFALSALSSLIMRFSLADGIAWSLGVTSESVGERLRTLMLFIDEGMIRREGASWEKLSPTDWRYFGTYTFERQNQGNLVKQFDKFSSHIGSIFSDYLGQYSRSSDALPEGIYRKQHAAYRTYFNHLIEIVYELVDNVTMHSGSQGLVAARVTHRQLLLYIGDLGIGVLNGIRNNYEVPRELDDGAVFGHMFRLKEGQFPRRLTRATDVGSGKGLQRCLSNIYRLNGRFAVATKNLLSVHVNPVSKAWQATKTVETRLFPKGTHYFMIFPLTSEEEQKMPRTADEFLGIED